MRSYSWTLLLACTYLLGCGPTPPEGYERWFIGDMITSFLYDDPTIPAGGSDTTAEIELRATSDRDVYAAEVYSCDLLLRVGDVSSSGVVGLSPEPFPATCTYTAVDRSTVDVAWNVADFDWSMDDLYVFLDGPFTSREAGREDRTGTFTLVFTAW